ncbi:MAG: hypothetical protein KF797_03915 [Flavobacteriales bacterium]|nr:hypothetical protein [Flavobacteriales bacterium]
MRAAILATLVGIFLTHSNPGLAQQVQFSSEYEVEMGKPYPVIDGSKRYFATKDAVICLKIDGKRWHVQKLSANGLTQTSMKQYQDMPEDLVIEYTGFFGDRLLIFYSLWDKKAEREQLFYREIDTEQGAFMGPGVRLLAVNGKVRGTMTASGFYRFHVTDKFDFIMTADDEHLVIQYAPVRDKKEAAVDYRVSVAVFDRQLAEEWKADIKMPYPASDMSTEDLTVDSKGDICIIASVYKGTEEKAKKRDAADWKYEFLRCTDRGAGWEISPLDLADRRLLSLVLFENSDGVLRAGGFYRKNKEQVGADGFFTCSFNDSDELSALTFHEIPMAIINQYASKREVKKNQKEEDKGEDLGLTNMVLSRVITDDDGSMLLVGEKRYTTIQCYTDSRGSTQCYTVWHADDLVICSVDPNGAQEWMRRLPKRMSSRAPIGHSYQFMHGNGASHFLHFGTSSGVELDSDGVHSNKGDRLVLADRLADGTGEHTRHAVLNTEEIKGIKLYQLAMDRLVRTGSGELLMEAYKKQKEDVLLRITIKE